MNGSNPNRRMVTAAPTEARGLAIAFVSQRKSVAPQGPLLAISKASMLLNRRGCLKYAHFSCPIHSERGYKRAAFVIVENTAMSELGWMGSLQARNGLSSIYRNIVAESTMEMMQRRRDPASHHHPDSNRHLFLFFGFDRSRYWDWRSSSEWPGGVGPTVGAGVSNTQSSCGVEVAIFCNIYMFPRCIGISK
jgi:hypothetical protein